MPKQDFSNYEKRLSIDHEQQSRSVMTYSVVWTYCRLRKCRRDRACTGPMLVSAHQNRKIRAQREIGLSGHACAKLPACIANASEEFFRLFEKDKDCLLDYLIKHPKGRLQKYDRRVEGRQPGRDTADP
jgi:hypothetical protein